MFVLSENGKIQNFMYIMKLTFLKCMEIRVGGYIRKLLAMILFYIFLYCPYFYSRHYIFIHLPLGQGRNPLFLFKIPVSEGSI